MQDDTNNNKEFSRVLTVLNKMGIHARPAAMIVRISNKYPSTDICVEKDGERVNGKSIMSLMMLAAGRGSKIKFVAQGEDAEQMLDEIEALFARAFDEKD
ncbi:MAG: HPr family phosphocarrier protein [Opitutales bacterium]|nr:HPr family phosphocarrier protein [Opitutales bacterium]